MSCFYPGNCFVSLLRSQTIRQIDPFYLRYRSYHRDFLKWVQLYRLRSPFVLDDLPVSNRDAGFVSLVCLVIQNGRPLFLGRP